jgi:hypothetical protein
VATRGTHVFHAREGQNAALLAAELFIQRILGVTHAVQLLLAGEAEAPLHEVRQIGGVATALAPS